MTTVAFRSGILAADSQLTSGNQKLRVKKLTRLGDGSLFAGTGDLAMVIRIQKWAELGMPDLKRPKMNKDACVECIVVRPCGEILLVDEDLEPMKIDDEFAAIGSGYGYALGAMALGATAEQAVEVAARFDASTSAPIHTMALKEVD